jgi:hypothetical protein
MDQVAMGEAKNTHPLSFDLRMPSLQVVTCLPEHHFLGQVSQGSDPRDLIYVKPIYV